MWEWDRAIVRPLAHDGLRRSLARQGAPPESAEAQRAAALLDRYFDWAPTVDDFVPIRVETDFDVNVPDPNDPGRDLVAPTGEPIRYQGRIDLLAIDGNDNYWIVDHRVVDDEWTDLDLLQLEERAASYCWAWELFFLGMKVAGVIYNELRVEGHSPAGDGVAAPVRAGHRRMYVQAGRGPGGITSQAGGDFARRTRLPRGPEELARLHVRLASEALDMSDPAVRVYPNPSPAHCGRCAYRSPCVATTVSGEATEILRASYRKREAEVPEEGRLGGVTWSMGRGAAPPKFSRDRESNRKE